MKAQQKNYPQQEEFIEIHERNKMKTAAHFYHSDECTVRLFDKNNSFIFAEQYTEHQNKELLNDIADREDQNEKLIELLNDLPENLPIYKDSGLWQLRSDDMEKIILQQEVNESFIDFLINVAKTKSK